MKKLTWLVRVTLSSIVGLVLMLTGLVPLVEGGAYQFPQLGARAGTMGNAFVALADDATAIFHNPAGLTQIEKSEAYYNLNLMFPDFTYQREANGQTYDNEYQQLRVMTPFFLGYATKSREYDFTSGFALYNSWGGLPVWRKEAPLRYVLKHNYLVILHGTYSMGYPLTDWLSIGGGLSLVYCYNEQNKSLDFQDLGGKEAEEDYWNEMDILVVGSGWGYNGILSALVHPNDDLSFGFTYTSETSMDLDVELKSTTPFLMSALMQTMTLKGKVNVTCPQNARIGVAYRFSDRLTTTFDVWWVNWDVVTDTNIRFGKGDFFIEDRDYIAIPRKWQDSYTFSAGMEYQLDLWEGSVFRMGYTYDEWAIPEETMMCDNPDANKHMISFGSAYAFNRKMIFDFGYEFRWYEDRHVTNSIYGTDDPAVVGGVANGYYRERIHAVYLGIRMID